MNFDIIHRNCRGDEVPKNVLKQCQTVGHEDVLKYPETKQNKFFSSVFRADRKDIYFEDKSIKIHFWEETVNNKKHFFKKVKPRTLLFCANSF